MKGKNQLDTQAVLRAQQNRIIKIAQSKPVETCNYCDRHLFMKVYEMRVVGAIESGMPNEVIVATNPIDVCCKCLKPFTREDKDEQTPIVPSDQPLP